MQMQTPSVAAKVKAASLAATLAPLIIGLIKTAYPQLPLPVYANDLLGDLIEAAILGGTTLAAGYAKAPHARDTVVPSEPPAPPAPPAVYSRVPADAPRAS